MKKNKIRFWLDLSMTIALCLLYSPHSTGQAFHEIAGLVLGGGILVHVFMNKDWVVGISKKIFSKSVKGKTRFSYVLNVILLLDMLVIGISGLLVSKVVLPKLGILPNVNWLSIHVFSSTLALVVVGIHIGLHWNWIKQMGSRFPKLAKWFTFRKPSPKIVARLVLAVGTIYMLTQLPDLVTQAPRMFQSASEMKKDMESHMKQKNGTGSQDQKREGHDGKDGVTVIGLLGNIPNLILYSAAFGTMAFYTYRVEGRWQRKRKLAVKAKEKLA
ncbi:DUF4405 domain-containing protein [Ectobacillus ponti]|uniref:DUF4405 domain-containing protein n=1 Tax=Ectobacillus ponti TaxID=2961894 RepID=A0AA41XBV4_9BACI|nr:DUF4405 domain-containing protein [Ectobacillus ponti]MCP8970489.1 DUF4405 domain-containing protein [Ectobacillus ponti]